MAIIALSHISFVFAMNIRVCACERLRIDRRQKTYICNLDFHSLIAIFVSSRRPQRKNDKTLTKAYTRRKKKFIANTRKALRKVNKRMPSNGKRNVCESQTAVNKIILTGLSSFSTIAKSYNLFASIRQNMRIIRLKNIRSSFMRAILTEKIESHAVKLNNRCFTFCNKRPTQFNGKMKWNEREKKINCNNIESLIIFGE